MAYSPKNQTNPPGNKVVSIPNPVAPLIEAFSYLDNEAKTKMLINQASKAIYATADDDEGLGFARCATKEEEDTVYALMKAINPKDMLETLAASQIIVTHMLGMRKLSQSNPEDQAMGMKLLRLSNDAMERLEKKRSGGHQNITVTYNNEGPSMQAIVSPDKA